jgi:hypothetical protein
MAKIQQSALVKAIDQFNDMDITAKEKIADEIYREQPNLLASVIVLNQMGNRLEHVEVILNILMVSYLALKNSGIKINKVSEKIQQKELEKLVNHANLTKNIDSKKEFEAMSRFVYDKSEEILMAFVLSTMEEAGLADLPKESSKYLMMSGINIVNCIGAAKAIK